MLAERTRLPLTLFVVAVATIAAIGTGERVKVNVLPQPVVQPMRIGCELQVREAMGLGDVAMICGRFADRPATFAIAFYKTTEWWERMAVVADDGTIIGSRSDRPSLPHWQGGYTVSFGLGDVDGDGVEEAVGTYTTNTAQLTDVIHVSPTHELVFESCVECKTRPIGSLAFDGNHFAYSIF